MGPTALFDKSFLQALSVDESVWFDHFFYPNICPLFYVETLADLTKTGSASGRSGEDEVRIIASKTPELSGAPCVHHRELCVWNLMGRIVPMNGQIPMAGGRSVQSPDGKTGVVYDETPEAQAFTRWQRGEFGEIERRFAYGWRQMLTTLDLSATTAHMRTLGIDPKRCKSIEDAYAIATALVHTRTKPFDQMALLCGFLEIPPDLQRPILKKWSIDQYRPLADHAPFAAHVLVVELFFQIALAANLISTERASNRVDVAYLFYLPFCTVFISSDKLHRKCAGVFLRKDQDFVWGPELKAELGRLNSEFASRPIEEREKGLMKFAPAPTGTPDQLLIKLWDRHTPGWRTRESSKVALTPEAERKLVEHLRQFTDAPTAGPTQGHYEGDPDRLAITHMVRKRKGSWWLLPKDLKTQEQDAPKGG